MADEMLEIHAIFNEAIALGSEEDRVRYLDQACCDNLQVRARVEALLRAHSEAGGFFGGKSPAGVATEIRPLTESLGTVIGPYKLLQQIGEGGMGTVYMAEQTKPVQRKVALKLIKPGMDSRQVISRFEAERQALALMDHPHIAKVLDAGTTESGRPFFVMELVKGVPITRFCDEHRLTPNQRLELFISVCQAVQHAHQKGIIHRDLKPSNVLVAEYDDRPVAKVIDFGVAKATGSKLTERTMFTELGQIVGTLEYMSPEQAKLNALDIDTRSDIYSLGVLLYELLTGTTPLEKRRFHQAAFDEMLRIIREDEPPKPSTRLSTTDELPSISANRGLEPKKLSDLVRGELDWIVMKALEKDRNRRYETANGFALDIQRYLADEPVAACPPSAIYRLRKFARRNKAAFAIGTTVATALVVSIVTLVVSNVLVRSESHQKDVALEEKGRALQQKDAALIEKGQALKAAENAAAAEKEANSQAQKRLEQVEKANDLLGSIFENLDPKEIAKEERPLQAILVEKLDRAVAELKGESIGDPLVVATVQNKFGASLLALGEPGKAIVLLEKARDTRRASLGREDRITILSMQTLATAYHDAGMLDLALPLCEETLQITNAKYGPEHPLTLTSMNNLASAYRDAGKLDPALRLFQETLELSKARRGGEHPDTLMSMNNLATAYQHAGRQDLALPLLEETVQLSKVKLGPEHPDTLTHTNNLALAYQATGKLDLAQRLFERTLQFRKVRQGPEHPLTLTCMSNLATVYQDAGKLDLALPLFEETLQLRKARRGTEHPETLTSMNNLANAYQAAGKLDLALPLFEETLRLRKIRQGIEHPLTLTAMNNFAMAYQAAGKLDLALPLLEKTLQLRKAKLGHDHPATLNSMGNLASAYEAAGKLDLALSLDEERIELKKARLGPEHPQTFAGLKYLAGAYERLGRLDEANAKLSALLKVQPDNLDVWYRRGLLQLKAGKWDEAVAGFAELVKKQPETAAQWQSRAEHFIRLGLFDEAAVDYGKTFELQEPADSLSFFIHALMRRYARDDSGYQRICRRMVDRFSGSKEGEDAFHVGLTLAIGPQSPAESSLMVASVERAVAESRPVWRLGGLGLACYRSGRYDGAVTALDESLALDPNWLSVGVHSCLAMAHFHLGNSGQAVASLDKAQGTRDAQLEATLAADIGFVRDPWRDFLLGELLYREARTLIDGSLPGDDPRLLILRARGLEVIGRADEAQALIANALALQPEDLRIRVLALPHVSRAETCAQGLADLRRFLKEHSNQPDESRLALARAFLQLGTRQWIAGRHPEAEAMLDQATEVAPQNAQVLFERGNLWLSAKQGARAIDDFSKAGKLQPGSAPLQFSIGTLLAQFGVWDEAAVHTGKALALDPSSDNLWWMMHASFVLRAGDTAEYRQVCQQMLERFRETQNPIIAHRVALTCLLIPDALGDQPALMDLARLSVSGAPQDGWCAITLGLASYRAGQFEQAAQHLRQVLKTWPDNPYDTGAVGENGAPLTTWLVLAMVCHRLDQTDEARLWLNKAARKMDQELDEEGMGRLRRESHVWAMCQVLRREAETLVKKDSRH